MSNSRKENKRCKWSEGVDDAYMAYHDKEWGVPTHDDQILFEFLVLEGAQAGLSWATILAKREGYRRRFAKFIPAKVAKFSDVELENILHDTSIVRNKKKVYSVRKNAIAFINIQEEYGSFDYYIWSFVDHKQRQNIFKKARDIPVSTEISEAISKDLKKRNFTFVGSKILYAYMQAVGMVNDHTTDCFRHAEIAYKNQVKF